MGEKGVCAAYGMLMGSGIGYPFTLAIREALVFDYPIFFVVHLFLKRRQRELS